MLSADATILTTSKGRSLVILLTGATGFIGHHLLDALAAKHEVICTSRHPPIEVQPDQRCRYIHADFTQDFDSAVWIPRLQGVDVVINSVGILRERGNQTFEALHIKAPQALFAGCVEAGVRLIVQISALGADEHAESQYHRSKKAADDFLLTLSVPSVIVQPSLVYGPGGTSARLFLMLASLPVIPLPGQGTQAVQPIHIDDLVMALMVLVEKDLYRRHRLPLVGPEPLSLRDFLARLRRAIHLGRPHFLPVPMGMVRLAAKLSHFSASALMDSETLQMLERGNVADATPTRNLLGREPRPAEDFVSPREARCLGEQSKLQWLLPVLRFSIALMWIVTGLLSLGIYPAAESYVLLARVGITGTAAPICLYGAALLDLAIGLCILIASRRRSLWLAQIAIIAGYTIIISWKLPEFWLHPYGPILKNLPVLAVIWLLYEFDER